MSDADAYDASRVVDLVEGKTTRYVGADVGSGAFVMSRFEVACAPTDAEMTKRAPASWSAPRAIPSRIHARISRRAEVRGDARKGTSTRAALTATHR